MNHKTTQGFISFAFQIIPQKFAAEQSWWHGKRTRGSAGDECSSSVLNSCALQLQRALTGLLKYITYYFSLMSHCLSHRDEWMQWHLMEGETKGQPWDEDDTQHLLLTFHFFFVLRAVRPPVIYSAWHTILSYIWHVSLNSVWPL